MQLKVQWGGGDGAANPLQRLQGQPSGLLPQLLHPYPRFLCHSLPQHELFMTRESNALLAVILFISTLELARIG